MSELATAIPSLRAKTLEGRISWEDLAGGSFITRLGELSVELRRDRDGDIFLSLLDESGRRIERTSDLPPQLAQMLDDLYERARRQALRVDERIDALHKKLDLL